MAPVASAMQRKPCLGCSHGRNSGLDARMDSWFRCQVCSHARGAIRRNLVVKLDWEGRGRRHTLANETPAAAAAARRSTGR